MGPPRSGLPRPPTTSPHALPSRRVCQCPVGTTVTGRPPHHSPSRPLRFRGTRLPAVLDRWVARGPSRKKEEDLKARFPLLKSTG